MFDMIKKFFGMKVAEAKPKSSRELIAQAEMALDEAEQAVKAENKRILVLRQRLEDMEELATKFEMFGHDTKQQRAKIIELNRTILKAEQNRNVMMFKVNNAVEALRLSKMLA